VSGLVLVTGAAGDGPGSTGRWVPSYGRNTTARSSSGSSAPRWSPGIR